VLDVFARDLRSPTRSCTTAFVVERLRERGAVFVDDLPRCPTARR